MDDFYERLMVRAATIDELLSDDFEPLPGQKGDADLAARRLAAWCRSCASGDWSLFGRRLDRDGLVDRSGAGEICHGSPQSFRFSAGVDRRRNLDRGGVAKPSQMPNRLPRLDQTRACVRSNTCSRQWSNKPRRCFGRISTARAFEQLNEAARACLRLSLLKELSGLSTPAIYERFVKARKASETPANAAEPRQEASTSPYNQFVAEMKAGGFRRLFEDKPVLLRLIASITRQWIDTSREFVLRLDADLATIR